MIFTSVKNGNWSDPSTWDQNKIPGDGDIINVAHHVICDPMMKSIKGAQVSLSSSEAVLDTSKIRFSGLRTNSSLTPSQAD